jgi:hypothetical protein
MTPYYWINGTPVYLVGGTTWVSGGALTAGPGWPYAYSIGGGALAPVPQGPAMAPPVKPRPEAPTEFGSPVDLADAALGYFSVWEPGKPDWYIGKLLSGAPQATAGAIEREVIKRNRERQTVLDTERLRINLRGYDLTGLVFMVEGIRRR